MKRLLIFTNIIWVLVISVIVLNAKSVKDDISKQEVSSPKPVETAYIVKTTQKLNKHEPENNAELDSDMQPYYSAITNSITEDDREILARIVWLEARGQSFLGQKAVVEVVLNRVLSSEFPNTIYEVIYQKNQFSPAQYIETTTPTQIQYDVVDEVLTEIYPVLNKNVLFFSTKQYNDLLYEQIGDHYFCYSTKSYELQKGSQQ